ncbi:AAA family ATPase [Steroidobacter sp.]|uniref:AAA family ATPase n=1 Tax=Steroidobacter sp. TaxID=1978227 RepID=UPI001A39C465|nr:AAA family ATPase [Steroidobacter sp.]MBL8265068.1 AAA family ATPase [Steroidobacter sp.]
MYLELFKLHELPFRLTPDPQFLYLSKHHARAKAYMESTIWFTDGFVVITGEIGSGKTTLIETFLKELEKDVVVAQINQTQVTAIEFLQSVLVQFGFSPFKMKKAELLATLNEFLVEQYSNGRRVLLIVDEAQNLSNKVLEEIRMLSGVETTKEKVLRIILAGQPELNDKLNAPGLVQLAQRIRLRFHLTALSKTDMAAYVQHRLEVAGSQGREIFESETFPLIYRYTGGIPRLVNTLADTSMMAAFAQDRPNVSVDDVKAAIEELQWVEYAERSVKLQALHGVPGSMNGGMHSGANGSEPTTGERRIVLGRILVGFNGQTIAERELTPGRFIIGRTPDNDLQIDSKYISRHHAQIITSIHTSVLEDLNSTNGIYVRAKRVRRRMLNDGDVVQIGQHEIMYFDERTNRSRTAFHEVDDDAQPLHDGPDRGHAATMAQDDISAALDDERDEQVEIK